MPYMITAELSTAVEANSQGVIEWVEANILSQQGNRITFCIPGEFSEQAGLTMRLCTTLIVAGFYSFEIGHSY